MNAVDRYQARAIGKPLLLLPLMAKMAMVLACTIALLGCSSERGLPTIVADRTTCSNCKMLVSETAYATAFRLGGEDQVFDDIGCMLDKLASETEWKPEQMWTRDHSSDTWIEAGSAAFAFSKLLKTPMGFGYVAYSDKTAAEGAASKVGGIVLSGVDALQAHYKNNEHAQN